MNFREKIGDLLKENMSERGFILWSGIDKRLPNIWSMPTSSTGKYHRKIDGRVPTISEHVYEMLYAAVKILNIFDIKPKTTDTDKILIAIALHDSLKYGIMGNRKHTDIKHDKIVADIVSENKDIFLKLLTEDQFYITEEMLRFHSGRWSTDVSNHEKFNFKDYNIYTFMIHMLDTLSTADIIKTDVRE
jgi:hypothetical protein